MLLVYVQCIKHCYLSQMTKVMNCSSEFELMRDTHISTSQASHGVCVCLTKLRLLQYFFYRNKHYQYQGTNWYVPQFFGRKLFQLYTLRPRQDGRHFAENIFSNAISQMKFIVFYWSFTVIYSQGLYSLRRRRLMGIGIPIINLRRSDDRLRFIMGIPLLIRRCLLSE